MTRSRTSSSSSSSSSSSLSALAAFVALSIVLLALPAVARAVPVAPGETVTPPFEEPFEPLGTLEQDESRPVSLTFTAPAGQTFDADGLQTTLAMDGTFRQRIYRDPATNRLTFVYGVELDASGLESLDLSASSFTGFTTDVTGDLATAEAPLYTFARSADGAAVTATRDQGLAGTGSTFAIFTDAEHFDAQGVAGIEAGNEFIVYENGSSAGGAGIVSDAFSLDAIFQPITEIEPPPPGVIPLPAAVWPGMILLGAAAMKVWRRAV